ncbi:MAG: hypothetical protein IKJ59_02365 [Clostridia bacterium]|nr:hypothetical protein [Clostridia bacterium]
MKKYVIKACNTIKLLVVYGSPFSVRNFIILAEFVIALVLSNLIYSFVTIDKNVSIQYKYMVDNNIVICSSVDEVQISYCKQNGESIGTVKNYTSFEKNTLSATAFKSTIYEESLVKNIQLPLFKGEWFANYKNCDFVAVVAYQYKNEFDVGKTYNLLCEDNMYNVYISGILEPHTDLLGDFICIDINSKIEALDESFIEYYKMKNIDTNKLEELGIIYFNEMYKETSYNATSDNVWNYILIISILVVFFAGYIGERLLNTDYQERLFATMFLCGISKKKAFVIQFFQGFFVLLVSVIIGRLILMFLYSVQFTTQFFVLDIFLYIAISALLVQMAISALFVYRISKKSIVQIIKGSDN